MNTILEPDKPDGGPVKSFLDHLEDLRRLILWILLVAVMGMAIAAQFAPAILIFLKRPLVKVVEHPETFLRTFDITGGMNLALQITIWGGILISAPFILIFIGHFVLPALRKKERDILLSWAGLAVGLFLGGAAMAYFYVLPQALRIMLWFNQWMGITVEFVRVSDYIQFVLFMMIGFGISFELPLILLVLGNLGIITSRQMRDKRRHAIIIILIIAMVITPTTDPVSQLIMSIPMVVLYELCIWITHAKERRRRG